MINLLLSLGATKRVARHEIPKKCKQKARESSQNQEQQLETKEPEEEVK